MPSSIVSHTIISKTQEYLPGGDLRNFLDRMSRLSEEHTRIYAAHIILAVEGLHELGYIHRFSSATLCNLYLAPLIQFL